MLFSMIFYLIACFIVANVLTVLAMFGRPIHTRDDVKSWKVFIWFMVLCVGLPYAAIEGLTRWQGPQMDKAIRSAYSATDVNGPLQYYKVTWYTGEKARAIMVGKEKQDWGGDEKPVLSVNLRKDKDGKWVADSFKSVNWSRKNKDGIVFPPFW